MKIADIKKCLRNYKQTSNEFVWIRFYGLDEMDMCIDCEDVINAGGLQDFLESLLEGEADDPEAVAYEILNRDYQPVDWEGEVTCHFVNSFGVNWTQMGEAFELLSSGQINSEVLDAGLALEIPIDKIEDAYRGQFDSDADYARDFFENSGYGSEIPEFIERHINWESMGQEVCQGISSHNNHYFDMECW